MQHGNRCLIEAQLADLALRGRCTVEHTYKDDERSRVDRVCHDGERYIVKHYRMSSGKTWLYHCCRLTPAWREHHAARRLAALGFRVAHPCVVAHRGGPLAARQVLVNQYIEGPMLDQLIREQPTTDPAELERLAAAAGGQIGRLTAAGLINRDHKPTNLIVDAACRTEGAEPVLIDLVGLRGRRAGRLERMLVNFLRAVYKSGGFSDAQWQACWSAAIAADPSLGSDAASLSAALHKKLGPPPKKEPSRMSLEDITEGAETQRHGEA